MGLGIKVCITKSGGQAMAEWEKGASDSLKRKGE